MRGDNFNTTLVIVYLRPCDRTAGLPEISIQLLLLFIGQELNKPLAVTNFNTTLVIVYHIFHVPHHTILQFQYNSCYCLSWFGFFLVFDGMQISIQLLLLFILI